MSTHEHDHRPRPPAHRVRAHARAPPRAGGGAMIQVRRSTYRDRVGWLICGSAPDGRRVQVFSESEDQARYIAHKIRASESWSFRDEYEEQPSAPTPIPPAWKVRSGA